MRLALKILGGLFGLLVALVLVGYLLPDDFEASTSMEIDAPPHEVFPLLNTQEGLRTWWTAVAESPVAQDYPDLTIVAPPGPDAGTGAKIDFTMDGKAIETWTILESTADTGVSYEIDFKSFTTHRILGLAPSATGTTVTWSETATIDSPLWRWSGVIMGTDGIVENFNSALRALKTAAEAPPAPATASNILPPTSGSTLRDHARYVLEERCGQCHRADLPSAQDGALWVYDLTRDDWSATMSDAQLLDLQARIEIDDRIPAEDVATIQEYVAAEIGRRGLPPPPADCAS